MSIATTVALQTAQLAAQVLIKPKYTSAIQNITDSNNAQLITIDPFTKKIGPKTIIADATVEERHMDRLEITNHPVETGAAITDHAFYHPPELTLVLGWSNSAKPSKLAQAADNKIAQIINRGDDPSGFINFVSKAMHFASGADASNVAALMQAGVNKSLNDRTVNNPKAMAACFKVIFSVNAFLATLAALSYPICRFKAVTSINELSKCFWTKPSSLVKRSSSILKMTSAPMWYAL